MSIQSEQGSTKQYIRSFVGSLLMGTLFSVVILWIVTTLFAVEWKNTSFSSVGKSLQTAFFHPLESYELASESEKFNSLLNQIWILFVVAVLFFLWKLRPKSYKPASDWGSNGTARWATPGEYHNNKNFFRISWAIPRLGWLNMKNPSGLIFGMTTSWIFWKRPLILPENTNIPNRNVFIVGPPGSAKSQGYVLTNLMKETKRSLVVTDPKGEIFELTARFKQSQGYEVRLINFMEMMVSDRYNPIDYIHNDHNAEEVAHTIVINSLPDQKADFWLKAEISLLKTLLLYVKYECPENATLSQVKHILTVECNTPQKMEEFMSQLEEDHPAYQSYLNFRAAGDKTRDNIMVSLGMTLSKYDSKEVQWFTQTSDFMLDDIGRRKIMLYVIMPVADSTWQALTSTFFTQLFQRLYRVADQNHNRLPVPVNFILDEFPNIGKIPNYEERLATCRSYGISFSTIIQSLGQLYTKYDENTAEAIIGNCALRYILGVNDKKTAEYFSTLLGKQTIRNEGSSLSTNDRGSNASLSYSYNERPLATLDELTRIEREHAILLVTGQNPIFLNKVYQFKFFKGLLRKENEIKRSDYFSLRGFPEGQYTSNTISSTKSYSNELRSLREGVGKLDRDLRQQENKSVVFDENYFRS